MGGRRKDGTAITVTGTERVPLSTLVPFPANPRRGNVPLIVESLRAHGQYRALVVNRRTGQVLAGNHTLLALREVGASEALVHFVDVDEDEAARIVLVDNRSNDLARYDDQALLELLQSLEELDGTGWLQEDLTRLMDAADFEPLGADTQPRLDEKAPVTCPECGHVFSP